MGIMLKRKNLIIAVLSIIFLISLGNSPIIKENNQKESVEKEWIIPKTKEIIINKLIEKAEEIVSNIPHTISKEKSIGKIIINKIQLEKPLYDIEDPENNVDKNITILKGSEYPNKENSILLIAAHSGMGKKAFFERLGELEIEDEIIINYEEKDYHYTVEKIYETVKDGYLHFNRNNKKQLILTTCCPDKENCQLIIDCIEKNIH